MAIDLSALFGQLPDYSAFLPNAEQDRMRANAAQQALLQSAISALSMTGQTRVPISTGQVLAGMLGAGSEGYNQAFDRTLKQMVTGMQLEEFRRKQRARELAGQAFRREPVPIEMATGAGSQLEMLSRPEFGGDMAVPETVAALRANLPTRTTVDRSRLAEAVAMGGDFAEAAKLLEPKETKLPGKIDEFVTAKRLGLIPENMTLTEYEKSGKTPLVTVSTGQKALAKADEDLVTNVSSQANSAREFARASDTINQALKGVGGGNVVKLQADFARSLGFETDTVRKSDLTNALVTQTAVKVRPPGSGATSDLEFKAYMSAVPSLANSEQGRELMTQVNKAFATRSSKIADYVRQSINDGTFTYEGLAAFDDKLGSVLPKNFTEQVNKISPQKQLGIPSTRGVKFLGFE